jgi:mRNA degradation ribonuclease J1/J2
MPSRPVIVGTKVPWNKNVFEMTHQLEHFYLFFFVTTDSIPEANCVFVITPDK